MNDKELKEHNGIFILEIECFSIHSSTDPSNTKVGCTCFMCSSWGEDYSANVALYDCYNNVALRLFVEGAKNMTS